LKLTASILLFQCAGLLFALSLRADVIDRIAASIDYRVITQSDLERQIRVTAFQDGVKPDLSPKHKREMLQTMIDQKLIQSDLENSRYPLPDPAALLPVIQQFKRDQFPSEAEYRLRLSQYGITEQDFKDLLLWQRTLLQFIEVRFESAEPPTDREISDYFEKTVKPAAMAAHPGEQVRLEDYREQIGKKLAAARADRQLEAWLQGARRRSQIVIHEEALK